MFYAFKLKSGSFRREHNNDAAAYLKMYPVHLYIIIILNITKSQYLSLISALN